MTCPDYYGLPSGLAEAHDVTDLQVLRYGAVPVMFHLIMQMEEYMWRLGQKGSVAVDLGKIATLGARLVALEQAYPGVLDTYHAAEAPAGLAEAVALLTAHGYGVIPPNTGAETPRVVGDLSFTPEPWEDSAASPPETIYQRAVTLWGNKHHTSMTSDASILLHSDLQKYGFQPTWHYTVHAAQCARLLPEWFLETQEGTL